MLFRNQDVENVQIYIPSANASTVFENYTAQRIVFHPSYTYNFAERTFEYDVALIQVGFTI